MLIRFLLYPTSHAHSCPSIHPPFSARSFPSTSSFSCSFFPFYILPLMLIRSLLYIHLLLLVLFLLYSSSPAHSSLSIPSFSCSPAHSIPSVVSFSCSFFFVISFSTFFFSSYLFSSSFLFTFLIPYSSSFSIPPSSPSQFSYSSPLLILLPLYAFISSCLLEESSSPGLLIAIVVLYWRNVFFIWRSLTSAAMMSFINNDQPIFYGVVIKSWVCTWVISSRHWKLLIVNTDMHFESGSSAEWPITVSPWIIG